MTTATTQFVKVSIQDKVAVVTIAHPPVNSLDATTLQELDTTFEQLGNDPGVKAIVLTGEGMAFVAGADINEIAAITEPSQAKELVSKGQGILNRIEGLKKPVIAAINGVALGGGLELAMACHMRVASDRARLGLVEINLGIMPGFGGTVRLPRIVGVAKATELILQAEQITAQEAYRIGLVNKVVPESDVVKQAVNIGKKIAGFGGKAIEAIMASLAFGQDNTLEASLDKEADLFAGLTLTSDMREGLEAFKGKRRPNFQDK